jgi:hypothetical protein
LRAEKNYTFDFRYADARVWVERCGWSVAAALRHEDGFDRVVFHLGDADGREWCRMFDYPCDETSRNTQAWQAWLAHESEALIAYFKDGVGAWPFSPASPAGSTSTTKWNDRFYRKILIDGSLDTSGIVRQSEPLMRQASQADRDEFPIGHFGFGFLLHADVRDLASALFRKHSWIAQTRPNTASMIAVGLYEAGSRGDCSAKELVRVMRTAEGLRKDLRGVTTSAVAAADSFNRPELDHYPCMLLGMLSRMPQSWMPRSREEYNAAADLLGMIYQSWTRYSDTDWTWTLYAGVKGRWAEFHHRISAMPACRNGLKAAAKDVDDMFRDFSSNIAYPVLACFHGDRMASQNVNALSKRYVVDGIGLATVLERSQEWHRRVGTLPMLKVPALPWEPLAEDFVGSNGIEVVFLTDRKSLQEEGRAMEHCVSGYASRCASGSSNIASIRRAGSGERLSTVDVGCGEGIPSVHQHRGFANAEPCGEACIALDEWLVAVRSGALSISRSDQPNTRRDVAYRIPEDGTPAAWRGILSPRYARMSWVELVSDIVGRETTEAEIVEKFEIGWTP